MINLNGNPMYIEKNICYDLTIKNSNFTNFESIASINYGNVTFENSM